MSLFDFGICYGAIGDASAMTKAQLAQRDFAMAFAMLNAEPQDYRLMQNYRPPVIVPEGWQDWYRFGDELN